MKTVGVTLRTTEVLDGKKCRPGDKVPLPTDHPVAVKTAALEKAAPTVEPKNAGRD